MEILFWGLMICWAIFGVVGYVRPLPDNRGWYVHGLFLFLLFLLIGWRTFGAPLK